MLIFCLHADEIDEQWHAFAPLLTRFENECKEMTAHGIKAAVMRSGQQLWGLRDETKVHALLITEIQATARGNICVIVGAVGTAPDKMKRTLLAFVRKWAKEDIGCVCLRIIGRHGWLRWDKRFRQTAIVAEAPL